MAKNMEIRECLSILDYRANVCSHNPKIHLEPGKNPVSSTDLQIWLYFGVPLEHVLAGETIDWSLTESAVPHVLICPFAGVQQLPRGSRGSSIPRAIWLQRRATLGS